MGIWNFVFGLGLAFASDFESRFWCASLHLFCGIWNTSSEEPSVQKVFRALSSSYNINIFYWCSLHSTRLAKCPNKYVNFSIQQYFIKLIKSLAENSLILTKSPSGRSSKETKMKINLFLCRVASRLLCYI